MKDHFASILRELRDHFLRAYIILKHRLACNNLRDHRTVQLVDPLIISQEVKSLDQFYISSCRRLPVILYHLASELLYYLCKALKADVDDIRLVGQQCAQLVGRCILRNICNFFRADLFYRLLEVSSDRTDRRTACKLVVLAYDHACAF